MNTSIKMRSADFNALRAGRRVRHSIGSDGMVTLSLADAKILADAAGRAFVAQERRLTKDRRVRELYDATLEPRQYAAPKAGKPGAHKCNHCKKVIAQTPVTFNAGTGRKHYHPHHAKHHLA